jgi:hypothetical protein
MEHKEQILFRKLLKKNGFVKSDTSDNKDLMEFTKNDFGDDDFIIVYTYDIVEVYFGCSSDFVVFTISHFVQLYKKHTGLIFLTN